MIYRCENCMEEITLGQTCPFCGHAAKLKENPNGLTPGTVLNDRYYIGRIYSEDFVTKVYIAYDNVLKTKAFIREYDGGGMLPEGDEFNHDSATKNQAVLRYINYGKSLAGVGMCNLLPKTFDIFTAKDKGYIVTEFFEGESLKQLLSAGVNISLQSAVKIAKSLCEGTKSLHRAHMIFGRICPETVYILKTTGEVKLFGIGSPFFDTVEDFDLRVKHINPSYAAPEIFDSAAKKGVFTDVYSVSAILYRLVTDTIPQVSFLRSGGDTLKSPAKLNKKIPKPLSNAIMNGINWQADLRTETTKQFLLDLEKEKVKRRVNVLGIFTSVLGFVNEKKQNRKGTNQKNKMFVWLGVAAVLLLAILVLILVLIFGGKNKESGITAEDTSSNISSGDVAYYGTGGTSSEIDFDDFLSGMGSETSSKKKTSSKENSSGSKTEKVSSEAEVSSQSPYVNVASVVGMNIEDATKKLAKQDINVKITGWEYSSKYAENNVISQNIAAGTTVSRGITVELVVSKGVERFFATVPSVIGEKVSVATETIKNAGFGTVKVKTQPHKEGNIPGTVVEQNFENIEIETDYEIILTVDGVEVSFPDYSGKSLADVNFSDFNVTLTDENGATLDINDSDRGNYSVVSQSIAAGEKTYTGSDVTLKVKSIQNENTD